MTVAVLLSLATGGGCATAPAAPPTVDLTGIWEGTWVQAGFTPNHGTVYLKLFQSGSEVTGEVQMTGPSTIAPTFRGVPVTGTVSGDGFRLQTRVGLSGELSMAEEQMVGYARVVDIPAATFNLALRRTCRFSICGLPGADPRG